MKNYCFSLLLKLKFSNQTGIYHFRAFGFSRKLEQKSVMVEQLKKLKERFREVQKELETEDILKNPQKYGELRRELSRLSPIHDLIEEYESCQTDIENAQEILKTERSPELITLAKEEVLDRESKLKEIERQLTHHITPKDPNDRKNIILEVRSGAGGDEAGLFAKELFEAYRNYGLKQSWKVEIISFSPGNAGGFKEVIANFKGNNVYRAFKYESGVHRVQRVPKTETQGRIHTSTVTVVVLPEPDPVEIKMLPEDLRIDVCRASGAGGQHVNTTDSAVRVVHLPTKIMVYCQQEKSQHANKERALKILSARLWDHQQREKEIAESAKRREQMGGGDRSQRIRTYNFPQSRLTDHRISFTQKNLSGVMAGNFESLFDKLHRHCQLKSSQQPPTSER